MYLPNPVLINVKYVGKYLTRNIILKHRGVLQL